MSRIMPVLAGLTLCLFWPLAKAQSAELELKPNDRIVFMGNTLAERMRHFGHFETMMLTQFPELRLTFRNMGWSADEVALRPRPMSFGDIHVHLADQRADVVFLFYGVNESFKGRDGLRDFIKAYQTLLDELLSREYNGKSAPRLVIVSPTPLEEKPLIPVEEQNENIALYSREMEKLAQKNGIPYVDLFTPLQKHMASGAEPLTFNGIHFTDAGYRALAPIMMAALGFEEGGTRATEALYEELRAKVNYKNQLFFDRWRAVNGFYIYGGRKEPFGVVSFPPEMQRFDELAAEADAVIADLAQQRLDAPLGVQVQN